LQFQLALQHSGTLVHFSAQPEPFLSLNIHGSPNVSHKRRLCCAEKWTSLSPCTLVHVEAQGTMTPRR